MESEILTTLSSLKNEINNVLGQIQGAADHGQDQGVEKLVTTGTKEEEGAGTQSIKTIDNIKPEEMSREDVKAQREAKKAAKAAKKSGAKGKEPSTSAASTPEGPKSKEANKNEMSKPKENKQKKPELKNEASPEPKAKPKTATPNNNNAVRAKELTTASKLEEKKKSTSDENKSRKSLKRIISGDSRVQTLFDHLPRATFPSLIFDPSSEHIVGISTHFISLGFKYSEGVIRGSNNRTKALISVLIQFIRDYRVPDEKVFILDFNGELNKNLEFLRKTRPFAVAMSNTIDYFKGFLQDMNSNSPVEDIKKILINVLREYEEERISKAKDAIVLRGQEKISNGDVVLIFGSSEIVWDIIVAAARCDNGSRRFSLVVVDSCSKLERSRTRKPLFYLNKIESFIESNHIDVTLIGINSLSNYIERVTKVFLGAHALLTNGAVLGSVGTSQIALLANVYNIPVLVCCETFKFCDKSPTDSFSLNELQKSSTFSANEGYLLNPLIKYDTTPPSLVSAVITDIEILPCTSVPVILRVQEGRATAAKKSSAL